ncbi:MAG: hypothetical protein ACRDL6_11640 [Solirubrobacterales bacterium]
MSARRPSGSRPRSSSAALGHTIPNLQASWVKMAGRSPAQRTTLCEIVETY